jgi:hypothetical protein
MRQRGSDSPFYNPAALSSGALRWKIRLSIPLLTIPLQKKEAI